MSFDPSQFNVNEMDHSFILPLFENLMQMKIGGKAEPKPEESIQQWKDIGDKTANMLSRAAILLTSVEDSLRATIEGLLHDAKSMPEIKVSENRSVYILKELKKAAEYKIMLLKHWKQDNVDTVEKFGEAGMSTSFMVIGRELTLKKEDGELQLMEEEYKKWKKEYQGEQKLDEDVEEKGSEEFDLEMMSTVNRMADLPLEDIAKLSAEELQKL